MKAVCISCGNQKTEPYKQCSRCGFRPTDDVSIAKSIVLSSRFRKRQTDEPPSKDELKAAARLIEAGDQYPFDERDVRRVLDEKAIALQPLSSAAKWQLGRFFALLFAVPIIATCIWLFRKFLN
jgi:hypothetical protein